MADGARTAAGHKEAAEPRRSEDRPERAIRRAADRSEQAAELCQKADWPEQAPEFRQASDRSKRVPEFRHAADRSERMAEFRHVPDPADASAELPIPVDLPDPERYSRQIRFAPIGPDGQRRLLESSVLIVGAGALGASLAQHMTRAGVGHIRIVDRDFVERSNLQRQTLFDEEDARLAMPKAAAAAAKLRRINSGIAIEEHVADVTRDNAAALAEGARLVLDGTDNAATRLVMSDVCFALGIPFLYGGAVGAAGMSAALVPGETACLRCLIGGEHEAAEAGTCETEGVISPIVELVAALQAAEALKWLSGRREALRRTWVSASLWPFGFREWRLPGPNRDCPVCGQAKPASDAGGTGRETGEANPARGVSGTSGRDASSGDRAERDASGGGRSVDRPEPPSSKAAGPIRTTVLCGRDTVQLTLDHPLPLDRIEKRLASGGWRITRNPWLIRAEAESGRRYVLFRNEGRVLAQGVPDAEEAVRGLMELLNLQDEEGVTAR